MKKNLFFDVGSTLHYPVTKNWFITPNFFNIVGTINKQVIEDAIKNNLHLLDERNISTELEEYEMFCKFYMHILQHIKYPNITTDIVNKLA